MANQPLPKFEKSVTTPTSSVSREQQQKISKMEAVTSSTMIHPQMMYYDDDRNIDEIKNLLTDLNLQDLPSIDNNNNDIDDRYNETIKLSRIDFDQYENINQTIKQLRKHNESIDLILATEDGVMEPIHKYYLALKAPKFWLRIKECKECMKDDDNDNNINSANNNNNQNQALNIVELYSDEGIVIRVPKILIPNLCGRMLKIIVETMYDSAQVSFFDYPLTWKLLQIANEYDLDFLIDACLNYLRRNHLTLRNCLLLFQVGLKFRHKLAKTSYRFIQVNLVKVLRVTTNDVNDPTSLMHLTLNQLTALVQDNRLNVSNEIYTWNLIYSWINFDCSKRLKHFWSLFPLIRFSMLDPELIRQQIVNEFALLNHQHGGFLIDSYRLQKPSINFEVFNPRIPHQILLLYGGYEDGFPCSTIQSFDIRAHKWFTIRTNQNYPRVYHKLVNFGHKVYIIGGSDGIHCVNMVICWDLLTGKFSLVRPMYEARSFHCAVRFGKFIIVCGGNNGRERLRSCEIYDPQRDTWRMIAPMCAIRSDASAAVLHNKLFVAGGIDIFALTSVEFYSFMTNHWTVVSYMHIQRRSFALVAHGGHLFAIGGCTEVYEFSCLRSMERYNPNTNTWTFVPALPSRRMSFSACVLEDKIFVIGGFNGYCSFRTVFCYQISSNHWQQLSYQLPYHLSGSCAVIVTDLSNAIDYTYYGRSIIDNRYVVKFSKLLTMAKSGKYFSHQKELIHFLFKESKKFHQQQKQNEEELERTDKRGKKILCSKCS